jgi:tRNA nucleotidyltransferase (CCA-adding enzyme)
LPIEYLKGPNAMPKEAEKVCASVLKRVTPGKQKRAEIAALAKKLEERVVLASKRLGIKAEVRVEGSVAKDTWLGDEPEIDIFMCVSPKIPRESLGNVCLRAAEEATEGYKQIESFAEHPYLEAFVDDVTVNIVPCYSVKQGEWLSATDRTPFHTDYIKEHLGKQLRGEVRLLKKFMKGVGVYGAEIKVGGFSGYLCELLVLHYGGFFRTLEAFASLRQRIVVDIENYYRNRDGELKLLFMEPLVLVDPVDSGRNVASAVQVQKLYSFVAAARAFLKAPDEAFFYPPKTIPLTVKELVNSLKSRGLALVFVAFGSVEAVPDVLWGELYKSQRSLRKLVQINDFNVLRDFAWSDEETLNMFAFELEQRVISPVKKHLGPPLDKKSECERFLDKHVGGPATVSGPYVEGGKWVVLVRRKFTDVVALLNDRLKNGGKNAGVAEQITYVLRKGFSVYVDEEVAGIYDRNRAFAEFLTDFLYGRPKWLRNQSA